MSKGRKYDTKKEREGVINHGRLKNFKRNAVQRTIARTATKTIRKNVDFSLVFDKEAKDYILTNKKKGGEVRLTKDQVQESELAMVALHVFVIKAREFFK